VGGSLVSAYQGNAGGFRTCHLAVQLDARDLHEISRFEIEAPVEGKKADAEFSTFQATPEGLRLTTLVRSFSSSGPVPVRELIEHPPRSFVYAINLEDRSNIFPPFELPVDNAAQTNRTPRNPTLSLDGRTLLVDMTTGGARVLPKQDLSKDRGYDVFDMTQRRRVAIFGGSPTPQDDGDSLHQRGRGAMSPDGRFFIFPVSAQKPGEDYPSGLVVVDLPTGQIVQRLQVHSSKEPDTVSISPDARRLVVFGPSFGRPIDTMHVFHLREAP
jgi:hypothetical protein